MAYSYDKRCPKCYTILYNIWSVGDNMCDTCYARYESNFHDVKDYRRGCDFKFNIMEYKDWFHSQFYIPKENISLDHMLSVQEGFRLKISPEIMHHPANCEPMTLTENISKNRKCSVSYHGLMDRIVEFEAIYGKYVYWPWKPVKFWRQGIDKREAC